MEEEQADKFYREFSAHLSHIDELANVILRGHLLVERDLDAVIEALFSIPNTSSGCVLSERRRLQGQWPYGR